MNVVNEGNAAWLSVALRDKDGNPAAPTSVTYRVDCMTTGTAVRGATTVASPGSSFVIELTGADNAIVDNADEQEYRRLTLAADYGAGDRLTAESDWMVRKARYAIP